MPDASRACAGGAGVRRHAHLRGRIVTAVDMRCWLGLAPAEAGKARMAIGSRARAVLWPADRCGREVIGCRWPGLENNPVNIDARLARVSAACIALTAIFWRARLDGCSISGSCEAA